MWLELTAALGLTTLGAAAFALWRVTRPLSTGQSGDLCLHRVTPHAALYRGFFSNAAILELPHHLVLIDTLISPKTARHMLHTLTSPSTLSSLSPPPALSKPIHSVVLTHFHGDHVGGTSAIPAGVPILSTALTAQWMREKDHERRRYTETFGMIAHDFPPVTPPTQTFQERLRLDIDGEALELLQLGPCETQDACVVWWPARRIIATGDGVSTLGYPWLGAPMFDEGLQADGGWIHYLQRIEALEPEVLLPGHGPPLLGRQVIKARLQALQQLMSALLTTTQEALRHENVLAQTALDPDAAGPANEPTESHAVGCPAPEVVQRVVDRVLEGMAPFAKRPEFMQNVSTQRFAVYRAINSLLPSRRGQGWWHDLRPPLLQPLPPLPPHLPAPQRAQLMGTQAEHLLDQIPKAPSIYDGSEYFSAAAQLATDALTLHPQDPTASLVLGIVEVWSAIILGQDMDPGIALLQRALDAKTLSPSQRRKANFFMGKAHQYEHRPGQADHWLRLAMPPWTRPAYPLFRAKLRAIP